MVSIKSLKEIELLREAGRIVALCHQEVRKMIAPGVTTKQLDDLVENIILQNGATPSCKGYHGYPKTICASVNEVIVHGIPSDNKVLKEGDIISVDICACYKGYHGDSAWTYAVGEISKENEELLEVTKNALFIGLDEVKPKNRVGDIGYAISKYCEGLGYSIADGFTGHGIGKNLHEDPIVFNKAEYNTGIELREGMVICVEPMVNIGTAQARILKDGWTAITRDKKNSAHFEHMVLVTKSGYEILTKL